jgi:CelD/BcsL family acetyltransferase involved in cellulose biosynthesis
MPMLQVVTDVSEFRALKGEWNNLASTFRNPLYCHEWFDDCLTAFGEGADLAVFVARTDGAVRAIAPLIVDRSEGKPRLCWLTHNLGDTDGFLYTDQESLLTVCAGVLQTGLPILLPGLRADSKEVEVLCEAPRPRGLLVVRPRSIATASISLDADWKTIEAKMSSKNRKYIRWARRAAEREGPMRFDVVSPTAATLEHHLDEAFRVEAAGWKGRAGSAIISNPRRKRFWIEFGRTATRLGILRLFFLRIGDATAAVRMSAEFAGRLWDWKIGYDERWARYSPGILLTHETLRYASERGLDGLEFLGHAEQWQHRWPINVRYRTTIRFYPLSLDGGCVLGEDAWRFVKRRVNGIFRPDSRTTGGSSDPNTA